MLPISQHTGTSYCNRPSASHFMANDAILDNISLAPRLNFPAVYPRDLIYMDFRNFIEHGTVPESESIQSCIAFWCIRNREPQALITLLKNGHIKNLDLDARYLDDDDAIVLASVLKSDETLLKISLAENNFKSEALEAICGALEENTTLIALDLGGIAIDAKSVAAVAKMLEKNKNLEILNLRFCDIGADVVPVLAKALEKNGKLNELDLSFNSIGLEGLGIILKTLEKAPSLKILDMSGNNIRPEAGELIAGMLKTNTTLNQLELVHNNLGSDGATPILNALKNNSTLKILSITENELDGHSAKHIGSLLETNTSIHTLNLARNRIFLPLDGLGVEAIDPIVHGLEHNTVMNNLDLTANHPGDKVFERSSDSLYKGGFHFQRDADMGLINDLLHRNRTFDALVERDAFLCTKLFPGQELFQDLGKVLAGAMIMAAPSTASYEATMVEIQCAVNVLASQT